MAFLHCTSFGHAPFAKESPTSQSKALQYSNLRQLAPTIRVAQGFAVKKYVPPGNPVPREV